MMQKQKIMSPKLLHKLCKFVVTDLCPAKSPAGLAGDAGSSAHRRCVKSSLSPDYGIVSGAMSGKVASLLCTRCWYSARDRFCFISIYSFIFHSSAERWLGGQTVRSPACSRGRARNTAALRLHHWQLLLSGWCWKNDAGFPFTTRLLFVFASE